jgi:hypothetical protein
MDAALGKFDDMAGNEPRHWVVNISEAEFFASMDESLRHGLNRVLIKSLTGEKTADWHGYTPLIVQAGAQLGSQSPTPEGSLSCSLSVSLSVMEQTLHLIRTVRNWATRTQSRRACVAQRHFLPFPSDTELQQAQKFTSCRWVRLGKSQNPVPPRS